MTWPENNFKKITRPANQPIIFAIIFQETDQ